MKKELQGANWCGKQLHTRVSRANRLKAEGSGSLAPGKTYPSRILEAYVEGLFKGVRGSGNAPHEMPPALEDAMGV